MAKSPPDTKDELSKSISRSKYAGYIDKDETVKKARSFLLYLILATDRRLVVVRKFPRVINTLNYASVVSIENKRLTNWGALGGFALFIALFLLLPSTYLSPLLTDFITILDVQLGGGVLPVAADIILAISVVCLFVAIYYAIKLVASFFNRLIIYQEGRQPLSIPMPMNQDTQALVSTVQKHIQETATPLTEERIKAIISSEMEKLLDERLKMQQQLKNKVKEQASKAETKEDKERIKQIIEEGIKRLEAKDEEIGKRLDQKGMKRDAVFKKYNIRPPKEEFVQSVLKEANLSDLKV